MTRMSASSLRIDPSVAWARRDACVVALDLDEPGAEPVVLTGTAAYIWEEIASAEKVTLSDLEARVRIDFGVVGDDVKDDIETLLLGLCDRGLLSPAADAPRAENDEA